ncbi:WD40 repeat-like protein [Venturia nashicola]|uniref:ASTRA-associated protein 1 n=1 Tax=Venturia nashicola TaxID=86259 RepID=A0A4Z1PPX8_9PEZI|nr:WD40 repeat-like protein [Venturia nashicola]TLD38083.1 WD40 repeat-like protein [Venturia nashicola]
MTSTIQTTTLPPAQPLYILRGHKAQVHAVKFIRSNRRLLTGDADGFVILWDIVSKRARVVWRAHLKSVLGLGSWGGDKVLSHGRDGTLKVWQLREEEEESFSTALPVEGGTEHWKEPWLLHSLDVNTLNFCAFSMCDAPVSQTSSLSAQDATTSPLLVAVPGTREGHVDIFSLPSERRLHSIPPAEEGRTGMVMALQILHINNSLYLIVGTESGLTSVQKLNSNSKKWETTYISKTHTQPILSLDVTSTTPSLATAAVSDVRYFTSSADALITLNPIQKLEENKPLKTSQTKHSGQQSLSVRSDGKMFATGGWDGRVRVYSAKSLKELAVLKWHKDGVYGVAFSEIGEGRDDQTIKGIGDVTGGTSEKGEVQVEKRVASRGESIVRRKREEKALETHWLAAGSKDGKVSLWEVY